MRIHAYCLMSNHVHLVAEPLQENSLALAIGHAHGKYAQWFNARHHLSGHLWEGRFFSCALDEAHLWAAVRYVEQNPARAGLAQQAQDWEWPDARAHCGLEQSTLLSAAGPFDGQIEDWATWINSGLTPDACARIRAATQTGRPCGDESFIQVFEDKLNRLLNPQKPGPKPMANDDSTPDMFL